MTFAELQTKWKDMKECGSEDFTISHLNSEYETTLECVKDYIRDFIVTESETIKSLYGMTESCDKTFSIRSMNFSESNFNEYTSGLNAYINDVCEKSVDADETFFEEMSTDIGNTLNASKVFVEKLFGDDENPKSDTSLSDALYCVESLQDVYGKCDALRESAEEILCTLESCKNSGCKNKLADLYYKTECSYLMEHVNECVNIYNFVKECVTAPVVVPQKPQVF